MKTTIILLTAFILAGCAPKYMWTRDSTSQQQFESDRIACTYESEKATAGFQINNGLVDGFELAQRKNKITELCLQTKGYLKRPAPESNSVAPLEPVVEKCVPPNLCNK